MIRRWFSRKPSTPAKFCRVCGKALAPDRYYKVFDPHTGEAIYPNEKRMVCPDQWCRGSGVAHGW